MILSVSFIPILQEEEEARKAEYERQRQIREAEMQDRMLAEEVGTARETVVVRQGRFLESSA